MISCGFRLLCMYAPVTGMKKDIASMLKLYTCDLKCLVCELLCVIVYVLCISTLFAIHQFRYLVVVVVVVDFLFCVFFF